MPVIFGAFIEDPKTVNIQPFFVHKGFEGRVKIAVNHYFSFISNMFVQIG